MLHSDIQQTANPPLTGWLERIGRRLGLRRIKVEIPLGRDSGYSVFDI